MTRNQNKVNNRFTNIYNGYGHRHTEHRRRSKYLQTYGDPKMTRNQNQKNKEIYDGYGHRHTQQNPEERRKLNTYKPMDT